MHDLDLSFGAGFEAHAAFLRLKPESQILGRQPDIMMFLGIEAGAIGLANLASGGADPDGAGGRNLAWAGNRNPAELAVEEQEIKALEGIPLGEQLDAVALIVECVAL